MTERPSIATSSVLCPMDRNTKVRAPTGSVRLYWPRSSVSVSWFVPPTTTRTVGSGDPSLALTTRPRTLSCARAELYPAATSARSGRLARTICNTSLGEGSRWHCRSGWSTVTPSGGYAGRPWPGRAVTLPWLLRRTVGFLNRFLALRLVQEARSEEHTSELQSHHDLVCRLLLEKKKNNKKGIK